MTPCTYTRQIRHFAIVIGRPFSPHSYARKKPDLILTTIFRAFGRSNRYGWQLTTTIPRGSLYIYLGLRRIRVIVNCQVPPSKYKKFYIYKKKKLRISLNNSLHRIVQISKSINKSLANRVICKICKFVVFFIIIHLNAKHCYKLLPIKDLTA